MYLSAKKHISGWKYGDEEVKYRTIAEIIGLGGMVCEDALSLTVSVNVVYWRKANAIHKWFVDNVQDGKDDCGEYDVSREQLGELVAVCEKVLASVGTAAKMLPIKGGFFFFGSTAYDEDYLQDVRLTVERVKPFLALEGFDFEYNSSW